MSMVTASVKPGKWDERFLALARHISEWSIDPSTKVGAVIVTGSNEVLAVGYNGFPRNVEPSTARLTRPEKYSWVEHAERNAIYAAARVGVPLEGCRMYLSWFPCMDCARAIIQAGVAEVVCNEPDWSLPKWGPEFASARTLLDEGRVKLKLMNSERPSEVGVP